MLNPRFYEDPPTANPPPPPPPFFFQILSNTPHLHLPATSNLRPHCSFCCPIFLVEWVIMPLDVLIYLMIIWICTCRALVPFNQGLDVCFMQQVATFTEVWHIMWFFNSTLIWYHTHKHTHNTQGPLDWHTQYLHYLLCVHSSYLY